MRVRQRGRAQRGGACNFPPFPARHRDVAAPTTRSPYFGLRLVIRRK